MTIRRTALCLLAALPPLGCASSPALVPDPAIEEQSRRRAAEEAALLERQNALQTVLLNLDKALDKYLEALNRPVTQRGEQLTTGLEEYLRETVAKHFDGILVAAEDASDPLNQARAVGVLGFSGRPEALDPLLNALRSPQEAVVVNAANALAFLRDERTPPEALAMLVEDPARDADTRRTAAWALQEVQQVVHEPRRAAPVWQRVLDQPAGAVDSWTVVQALRGIGLLRDPAFAPLVEPYTADPTPMVRAAACIALGRLGNRGSHAALLRCLDLSETNQNVRLAARKGLQALAGNVDRGYDVKGWRRVFEDGNG